MNEMRLTSDTLGPQYLAVNIRRDENTYEPIVTLHGDGRVEVATWATVDDAAREFWDAVLRLNPLLAAGDACEANAKSERASLPDRVEAARALYELLEVQGVLRYAVGGWDNRSEFEKDKYRRALAAADACEAERNPNPTARPFVVDVDDEVTERPPTRKRWRRRPVSSEDVHREDKT